MFKKHCLKVLITALLLVYLFTGRIDLVLEPGTFLTLHLTLEFTSVIVSMLVSIFCWYEYRYQQQQKMLIMAFTFCLTGITDFVHTLSYLGMPEFITANSANKASTFWVLARLSQGIGLLLAFFLPDKKLRIPVPGVFLAVGTLIWLLVITAVGVFLSWLPAMYNPGTQDQTVIKIAAEYIVILLYILTATKIKQSKSADPRDTWLVYALVVGIFGELAFAKYVYVYDTYNLLGHLFKILSFSLILKGLFEEAIGQLYRNNEALAAQRRELAGVNRQLKEADQLKDKFLANTNHELRSPLTAIIAFTELLADRNTGPLNPLQRDYLNEIADSSMDETAGEATISVEDSGTGIDPSEQEAVFEMFYQVDGTSSRSYGGTGIGLSLVKNLVEMHGGSVSLESRHPGGSKFSFTLPLFTK